MAVAGTYKEIYGIVKYTLQNGCSVLVLGSPGVGKSTMARELAVDMGFKKYVDLRLAQRDAVEVCGMFVPNREQRTVEQYRADWVPVDEPAFINLDEINAAISKQHQATAYQIVLEHRVGPHEFAPGTVVMGCGNLAEDNAIAMELSSALNGRFAHFILKPDVDCWLEWAPRNDVSADYMAYIAFRGLEALYKNTGERAFPNPRSNARAGKLSVMRGVNIDDENARLDFLWKIVASQTGEAQASEYIKFLKVYRHINLQDIFLGGDIPDFSPGKATGEPSFLYALIFSSVDYISSSQSVRENDGTVMKNAARLISDLGNRAEYQAIMLKQLVQRGMIEALRSAAPEEFRRFVPRIAHIMEKARKIGVAA